MPHRPALAAAVSLALALSAALVSGPTASAAPALAKPYDFDGDGFVDLVVGAPRLTVGDSALTGGVVVLRGSRTAPSLDDQLVTRPGGTSTESIFGTALASADFDRDGFADLAVGAPGESGRYDPSGAVHVLHGSKAGLTDTGATRLTQVGGEDFDSGFGRALAAADFDGDGWPDLAVSAPLTEEAGTTPATGVVSVYRGGPGGFSVSRGSVLRGDRSSTRYDVGFGSSLTVGDLDGDGRADLVVGSDGAVYGDGYGFPGSVSACDGAPRGLTTCDQLDRDSALAGLGSLAVGDVRLSARPEVVVGVPRSRRNHEDGGTVQVLTLPGAGDDPGAVTREEVSQDSKGVPGSEEDGDLFGDDVALADLDRDGYADLVVGAPGEDVGTKKDAGRVTVLYGGALGFRTSGNRTLDRATKGVPGSLGRGDRFGDAVSLVDHDGDGRPDLAVGAPLDAGSGAVTALRGSGTAFTTTGARTFTLKTLGHPTSGRALFGDTFGR